MPIELASLELRWPRDVFQRALGDLLALGGGSDSHARAGLLLEEALGDTMVGELGPIGSPAGYQLIQELYGRVNEIPHVDQRVPVYSRRMSGAPTAAPVSRDTTMRSFNRLIGELWESGYLDRVFPKGCVDDHSGMIPRHPGDQLEERTGRAGLWPLNVDAWEWTFALIEHS